MANTMTEIEMETVQRAFVDLQLLCSGFEDDKAGQKIHDLEGEIRTRNHHVETLKAQFEDTTSAADLVRAVDPALALAFDRRAAILLDEIEKAKPYAMEKKLRDLQMQRREVQSISQFLRATKLEVLSVG